MKINVIKCSDGFFIQKEKDGYHDGGKDLAFAGEKVSPTWKNDWFKVSQINLPVSKVIPEKQEVIAYELKEEYQPTMAMPFRVMPEFFMYQGNDVYLNGDIRPLYTPVTKPIPECLEDVEAELVIIAEIDGNLSEKRIDFPVYGKWASDGKKWSVNNQNIRVSLVDEITLPKILHQEVPCELSSEDSYKIIRSHIKDNINPKVAKISNDYDFCLSVEKRIPLSEQEKTIVDENAWSGIFGGRKKKPKFVTKYRVERSVKVYETAPRINGTVYKGYEMTQPFRGKDADNLKKNINAFLEALMEEINLPVIDCPTCKGIGVVKPLD